MSKNINAKKRRHVIYLIVLVLLLTVAYGLWSHTLIDGLDFSADEVAAVHIGSSHTNGFPEITDKEDIQSIIDRFNNMQHAVKLEIPGMSGCIYYNFKFTMEDGRELRLDITSSDSKDHRTAPSVTVRYKIDEKPRLLSGARGSMAFFYEVHSKYAPET